ncbi:MAG: hypothetical protein DRP71_15675 [Verrucomicrobia bacterium]|nr:MAG: hypothetical protein DRP71_15675 [Verrucomicrobiota bacterium]
MKWELELSRPRASLLPEWLVGALWLILLSTAVAQALEKTNAVPWHLDGIFMIGIAVILTYNLSRKNYYATIGSLALVVGGIILLFPVSGALNTFQIALGVLVVILGGVIALRTLRISREGANNPVRETPAKAAAPDL